MPVEGGGLLLFLLMVMEEDASLSIADEEEYEDDDDELLLRLADNWIAAIAYMEWNMEAMTIFSFAVSLGIPNLMSIG